MESHILLLNADSAGTETLKNLVLPGVGMFTILDEHLLEESDLGSNFFCDASGLGKPRGDRVTELLCEMNSDVRGSAVFGNLSSAVALDADFLSRFTLVIASNLPEAHLLQLSEGCWQRNIPLIVVRSYGLLGYVRIQVKQHDVIESKPDGQTAPIVWDLRMSNPFPELVSFCKGVDFAELDWMTHSHVPYVVILTKVVEQWKATHGGQLPATKADKEAFVACIKALSNNNIPADYQAKMDREAAEGSKPVPWTNVEKENFQEADREAYRSYQTLHVPGELQDLMAQEIATAPSRSDSDTTLLLRALHAFIQQSPNGSVPLSGQIPDMFSNTDLYISLQEVYQQKAAADKTVFTALLVEQAAAAGRAVAAAGADAGQDLGGCVVPQDTIDTFCKNIFNMRRVCTRSIAQEYSEPEMDNLQMALFDAAESVNPEPAQAPILWYFALRAADRYRSKHGRWPGTASDDPAVLSEEADAVWAECQALQGEMGVAEQMADVLRRDHAVEIVRYGAGDVHNIGAIVGGIAAQEAVKLITHQYVPLNNTYLFNGIVCAGKAFEL